MLDHSEVSVVVAQDQEQVDKILSVRDRLPRLRTFSSTSRAGSATIASRASRALDAVMAEGRAALETGGAAELDRRIDAGKGSDPSVILYTSGTTGRSKGVVLSGERAIAAARDTVAFDRLTDRDEVLAYLPLAWVGDHYLNYAQAYVAGFCMACPESAETAAGDLREIGPTYHFAPPRVFEALLTQVQIRMEDAGAVKRWLFRRSMDVAARWGEKLANGEKVPISARLAYGLGDLLIYAPAQERPRFLAHPRRLHRGRGYRRRPLRLLPLDRAQPEAALRTDRSLPLSHRATRWRGAIRRGRTARARRRSAHRARRGGAVQVAWHVRRLFPRA